MDGKAVVFTEPGAVAFRDVSCPEPGPRDVVVRLRYTWISNGTEGSYLRGERLNGDTPRREHDPWPFPIVPGYQQIGQVERVGPQVDDLTPGQWVFGVCGQVEGMFQPCGGHVSPSVAARDAVWALPDEGDPLRFGPLVLCQVGYNCATRPPIEPGQHAVVLGDGLVGQWAAQTLAWRGAEVTVVGRHESRLEKARAYASARTLLAKDDDWLPALAEMTRGQAAVAVDTVGSAELTRRMIDVMRRGGHLVSAGFIAGDDRISLQSLRDRELSLDSVASLVPERMNNTLRLIAEGRLQTLPLVTHRFAAAEAAAAWQLIQSKRDGVLGVVLEW